MILEENSQEVILHCRTCKLTQVRTSDRAKKAVREQLQQERFAAMAAARKTRVIFS